MLKQAFWQKLEGRVSSEIADLTDNSFHDYSCRVFTPQRLGLVGDRQAVIGTVQMSIENDQQLWHFALLLETEVHHMSEIDWPQLVPPDAVTGWLSLNRLKKEMKIDLAGSFPDPSSE